MKHEQSNHFDQCDADEVVQSARPDQILRLLRDIAELPLEADAKTAGARNEDR